VVSFGDKRKFLFTHWCGGKCFPCNATAFQSCRFLSHQCKEHAKVLALRIFHYTDSPTLLNNDLRSSRQSWGHPLQIDPTQFFLFHHSRFPHRKRLCLWPFGLRVVTVRKSILFTQWSNSKHHAYPVATARRVRRRLATIFIFVFGQQQYLLSGLYGKANRTQPRR